MIAIRHICMCLFRKFYLLPILAKARECDQKSENEMLQNWGYGFNEAPEHTLKEQKGTII